MTTQQLGPLRIQNLLGSSVDPRSVRPAPLLGEHTRAIATEAGLNNRQIDELLASGCMVQAG